MEKDLLTIPELAAYLGKSKWTVYHTYQQIGIPWVKVGASVRFRRASVEAWLAAQEQGGD